VGRDAMDVVRQGRDVAAEVVGESPWMGGLARGGLLARGLLYVLVSILALQVAWGDKGRRPDTEGAVEAVAHQPLGRVLLGVLAIGFAAYAVSQLVEGVLDPGERDRGPVERAACLGRGALYCGVFVVTVPFIVSTGGGENADREVDLTARLLGLPFGPLVVAAVGLGMIVTGLYNGYRAMRANYREHLDIEEMGRGLRRVLAAVAAAGYVARMAVFGLIGAFLVRAALQFDAKEAVGVDEALKRLADHPYGSWLLVLVALGLAAFGLYLAFEARYRGVPEP
jgi:hypothetical protein